MQDWWASLLQGVISAVVGGAVAALTAWAVVSATRRHERRIAMEKEARTAALNFFVMLGEIQSHLACAVRTRAVVPLITDTKDWALNALTVEVAMFSLDEVFGARISQDIGDLRRALEQVEDVDRPDPALVEQSVTAWQTLADRLADWLMSGKHLSAGFPTVAAKPG
jgi:hypothetical protein